MQTRALESLEAGAGGPPHHAALLHVPTVWLLPFPRTTPPLSSGEKQLVVGPCLSPDLPPVGPEESSAPQF